MTETTTRPSRPSPQVRAACSWCGGGHDGFIRYQRDDAHAAWCPSHNQAMHAALTAVHRPRPQGTERQESETRILVRLLARRGWPNEAIAAELDLDRNDVARWTR